MIARDVKLDWATHDEAMLTIRCASVEDFRAFVALLSADRPPVVFDGEGKGVCIRAAGPAIEPIEADLPQDVAFRVRTEDPPPNSPRWMMRLANNFLQTVIAVRVIDQLWDESVPRRCRLTAVADSADEYVQLGTLFDHERGSSLLSLKGDRWYVRRLSDNGTPSESFPQVVEFLLEEVPLDEHYYPPASQPYLPDEVGAWLIPLAQRWDLDQDLEAFTAALEPDTRIERRGEALYLTSERFAVASNLDDAYEVARPMVMVLNAAASLASASDGNYRSVELGPQAIVVLTDGRELEHPAPPEGLRVTVVGGDEDVWSTERRDAIRRAAVRHGAAPTVAQVLRLWMTRPHTWASLYVIIELVEHDARGAVSARGWATKSDRELFRHTANSLPVDENLPRHGSSTRPPSRPMEFADAVNFVRGVVGSWLLWIDERQGVAETARSGRGMRRPGNDAQR